MQGRVIKFKDKKSSIPDDLLTVTELSKILKVSYHYLYKWSVLAKRQGVEHIEPYYFGALKLSESETKNFIKWRSEKRCRG